MIMTQCWIDVVSGKEKWRVYGIRKFAPNYIMGKGSLKHQLKRHDQEYNDLRQEFANFKELVMRLLSSPSQTYIPQP